MAKTHFTCPHCHGQIKVIPQRKRARPSPGFQSVAQALPGQAQEPPKSLMGSLLWFLKGNKADLPQVTRPTDQTIKIEVWDHPQQTVQFEHLDRRVTVGIVFDIALMIENGHDWTRANLVRYTRLSENKCRVVVREFKRLGYLRVSPNNRSVLTPPGKRFLRGIRATNAPPPPNTQQHTTKKDGAK